MSDTSPAQHPTISTSHRALRISVAVALVLVVLLAVGPLVLPIPPLRDTVPHRDLAGPDSEWFDVEGVDTHVLQSGEGTCGVVLLHGFGASTFSWRETMPALSDRTRVVAYDRPAFGITERPRPDRRSTEASNPYGLTAQADGVIGVMDAVDLERAVLVGHSAGAAVAVLAADRHPERVRGLVFVSPAIHRSNPVPDWLMPVLRSPQMRRIGPWLSRSLGGDLGRQTLRDSFWDPGLVTDDVLAGYELATRAHGWDEALWEFTVAPRPDDPAEALGRISVPILIVSGTEDAIVPYAASVRVAEETGARLVPFPETGHIAHEERPERFATELYRFLDDLEPACEGCR